MDKVVVVEEEGEDKVREVEVGEEGEYTLDNSHHIDLILALHHQDNNHIVYQHIHLLFAKMALI
jgi:hypothetical protein